MDHLLDTVRNAVRALILQDGKLLVLKKTDGGYSLPGGAPNVDETLVEGLERECLEEIGCQIQVQQLAYVGDFYKKRATHPPTTRHQIEFFFQCQVPENYQPHNGYHPDKRQVDVEWLEISSLMTQSIQPPGIKEPIQRLALMPVESPSQSIYLGHL